MIGHHVESKRARFEVWCGVCLSLQVVSKMGKGNKSAGQILSELGFTGVWGGLGTRIIMIGTLTGLQWWIYDTFKTTMGLGTSGGGGGAKKH
jgi:solute carrier family 25 phosphate transporter 3